jgi:CheY-like chemotaxis protein
LQVSIRCRYCGARDAISESMLASLGGRSSLVRSCSTCHAGTPWDVQGQETSSFAGARLADEGESGARLPRVLLVDDDTSVLEIVGRALAREALEVETASSGREALNRMVREDFDLVMCDVRMPEFDGKQLFKFIEEHLPEQKHNVIFLTGDFGTESTAEFFQQAGVPFLSKPLDLPLLVRMVRDRLGLAVALGGEDVSRAENPTS